MVNISEDAKLAMGAPVNRSSMAKNGLPIRLKTNSTRDTFLCRFSSTRRGKKEGCLDFSVVAPFHNCQAHVNPRFETGCCFRLHIMSLLSKMQQWLWASCMSSYNQIQPRTVRDLPFSNASSELGSLPTDQFNARARQAGS